MSHEADLRTASLRSLVREVHELTVAGAETSPYSTAIEDVLILRSDRARVPSYRVFQPALCITVQGAKWTTFGDQRYVYGAGQAMVVTLDMPSQGAVFQATPGEPYLGIVLALHLSVLHELVEQMMPQSPSAAAGEGIPGVCVVDLCAQALDCLRRLLGLLRTPGAIPLLYPALQRELCYWLLSGPGAEQVLRAAKGSRRDNRLVAAIYALKTRYSEQLRVEELAKIAGMSPATFHRQFKASTAMSPLQYQKQLRLLEARRLMLTSGANVETAATRVGYESSSQFSREYARMFGKPPRRDVHALAEAKFPPLPVGSAHAAMEG